MRLLTARDLAARWQCAYKTVCEIVRRDGFPAVARKDAQGGRSWEEEAIYAWERTAQPVRREAPPQFCLYRHFDAAGVLLYVGQSTSAVARQGGHKDSPWFREIATITLEHLPSQDALNAAELAAIKSERPKHNKAGVTRPYTKRGEL